MSLFKYLDTLTPKVYILQLGDLVLAKVGYTSKDIKTRIKDYKFSGQWTGREGDIRLHAVFTTPTAKSVEPAGTAAFASSSTSAICMLFAPPSFATVGKINL